jgi:hypothetical protein
MRTNGTRRGWIAAALVAASWIACAPRAGAADPAADAALKEATAKVDDLEKQVKKHLLVTTADDALRQDIVSATKLTTELSDEKLKTRCLDLVGLILKTTTHDDLERDAIKAIGTIGRADGGRLVVGYLRQATPADQPPLLPDAIECCGKIKSDATVPPMIEIVEKTKVFPLAVACMKSLSAFGLNKRVREKILVALVDSLEKDRPGLSYRWRSTGNDDATRTDKTASGEDARTRYDALAGEMCSALNKLTGMNVATPEEWFDLKKQYKSDMKALFQAQKEPGK